MLSAEDRLDLEALLVRHQHAARAADPEPFLRQIFTDDAVLDGPRGYHVGLAGL